MAQDLKLRPEFRDPEAKECLPPHVLEALNQIEEWSLEAATLCAVQAGDLSKKEVDEVERELRRFLAVVLLAREGFVEKDVVAPSSKVDALWHAFILDTQSYLSFSELVLGGYLHHHPEPEQRPVSGKGMRRALETYFDGVDVDGIWAGQLARCWPPI